MARYLVTGSSRGIGAHTLRRLVAAGHEVIGLVRPREDSPVESQRGDGARWVADLARPEQLQTTLADRIAELGGEGLDSGIDSGIDGIDGGLDGVVHAAGCVLPGALSQSAVHEFTEQFTVNVTAVAELTRLLLPALRRRRGTVVLVNSGSGLNARPPLSSYGASKFALRAYADALRQEESMLRVSTVYPGRTATDMQKVVREAEGGRYDESAYLQPETVAGVICSVLWLPADGVITDVTVRPAGHPGPSSPDAHH
ncbi:SDR family oxidoreductase [Jatrophihabitans telluris]|uniref:SDR family oxidoreductase n=1 Tax=Jatrophihabitans telluris TaxID=2038343 RepID=A0ABY4QXR4_9ACTN|nr:SDR family oxidoreductase [Jatrophihabitans telluris]UQX88154.1 SDR family oxidoreductase [Jatrophihabitans telluris]